MAAVSIIVPVYNGERFIKKCIESLQQQSLQDIEILIVDDGSTDRTQEMIEPFLCDNRIHLIKKENGGPGSARNTGIEYAKGKYIAFMDCDDKPAPSMYQELYNAAQINKSDSCMCGYRKIFEDGHVEKCPNPLGNRTFSGNEVQKEVLAGILGARPEDQAEFILGISVWKALYLRELIMEYGIRFYSEKEYYSEDTLFNIDYFLKAQRVTMLCECYYDYCKFNSTYTKKITKNLFEKDVKFYLLAEIKLHNLENSDDLQVRLQRLFLGFLRFCLKSSVYGESFFRCIKYIQLVCDDPTVREIYGKYPYHRNPLKQKFLNYALARKHLLTVWILIRMHGSK